MVDETEPPKGRALTVPCWSTHLCCRDTGGVADSSSVAALLSTWFASTRSLRRGRHQQFNVDGRLFEAVDHPFAMLWPVTLGRTYVRSPFAVRWFTAGTRADLG